MSRPGNNGSRHLWSRGANGPKTIKVLLVVASITTAFEVLKNVRDQHLAIWESEFLTVFFNACLVMIVVLMIRSKERRFSRRLQDEIKTSREFEIQLQKSEEQMRLAVEAAGIGFWDWDILNGDQSWSDSAKALLGLPVDAPASLPVFMGAIYPEDREIMGSSIERSVQKQEEHLVEFRALWPDGTVHWLLARGIVKVNEAGQPARMLGIVMNIDSRKSAKEALRLQAAVLAAAANSIVITDKGGVILWTNPAFSALTGYSANEAKGHALNLLRSGKHDQSFYESLWNTVLSGRVWHGELVNRRKDGSLYTEEQTITPVRSDREKLRISWPSNRTLPNASCWKSSIGSLKRWKPSANSQVALPMISTMLSA